MCLLMSRRVAVFDLLLLLQQFSTILCVCMCEQENVNGRQQDCVMFKICRDRQRFCRQTERTSYSIAWLSQGKRREGKKRHKRPSWLVLLHQPSIFPLTHGTRMKTDFKRVDEKHSLLKTKWFTMAACTNIVVLLEKWTTVKLANRFSLRFDLTQKPCSCVAYLTGLCGLVIYKIHITNHIPPLIPYNKNFKNPTLLKHIRAFKT